jgi:hypothetical protein
MLYCSLFLTLFVDFSFMTVINFFLLNKIIYSLSRTAEDKHKITPDSSIIFVTNENHRTTRIY